MNATQFSKWWFTYIPFTPAPHTLWSLGGQIILLFSRRILWSKKPDSYSDDSFFLQTTDLTLKGPLLQKLLKLLRPSPADANSPFQFFFGTVRPFSKFFKCPWGLPFESFDVLRNVCWYIQKSPNFYIFRHCVTLSERKKPKISSFFQNKRFALFEP